MTIALSIALIMAWILCLVLAREYTRLKRRLELQKQIVEWMSNNVSAAIKATPARKQSPAEWPDTIEPK